MAFRRQSAVTRYNTVVLPVLVSRGLLSDKGPADGQADRTNNNNYISVPPAAFKVSWII